MRSWKAVELKGKDAQDFLHRLTTVAVKSLPPGQGSTGLLLTGTGKVIADFFLLHPAPELFYLVTDAPSVDRLYEEFEKLHFSEAFSLRRLECAARLKKGAVFSRPFSLAREADEILFPLPEGFTAAISFSTESSAINSKEWEFLRILAKVPRPGSEWLPGETNALDCGFLPWIDRTKGCYPGQEVVERSLNVGHPARSLVLLESPAELTAGDDLAAENPCGKITSAALKAEGGSIALGIVQWSKRDTDRFTVPGKGVAVCRK